VYSVLPVLSEFDGKGSPGLGLGTPTGISLVVVSILVIIMFKPLQLSDLVILWKGQVPAVTAPGSMELDQNIVLQIIDNLFVVVGNNDLDGAVRFGNGTNWIHWTSQNIVG